MYNGRAENNPTILAPLLARFARWSAARAALQVTTFILVAVAIGAGT